MNNKFKVILILFNINDKKKLNLIINKILNKKLSSCINIDSKIKSYYFWKNKLKIKKEIKVFIKTFKNLENKIIKIIKKNHPYKISEIITLNINNINKEYLKWMKKVINIK